MYDTYLKRAKSKIGKGVLTTANIPAGVPILEFGGDIFTDATLKHETGQTLQIGNNLHLGPSGKIDDYINHSCSPNCSLHIVGNRAFLYSLYAISADSEITFDYSTSSTDNVGEWKMECRCQSPNCRKIISGFQHLDPKLQEEYRKCGLVPLFMRHVAFGGK